MGVIGKDSWVRGTSVDSVMVHVDRRVSRDHRESSGLIILFCSPRFIKRLLPIRRGKEGNKRMME